MSPILITVGLLLASAAVIYLACEFFVNGVEWIGQKFDVGQKATGTVLAAFGTALPESVVTFAAVVFGHTPAEKEIGVGAALGGPLVLATIAYAVVGWTLFATKRPLAATASDRAAFAQLSRDQAWFLAIFLVKLALGLAVFAYKPWLGLAFLAAYAVYAWKETRGGGKADEQVDLEPLKLAPKRATPPATLAVAQTLMALIVIYLASRFFVSQINALGPALGLRQLLALLLSPIATELPETLNAVIWIRQGKVRLALANISGAMMIQATVPTAFGLLFTPWLLDRPLLIGGAVTAVSILLLLLAFRNGWISRTLLAGMAAGYALFVGILVLAKIQS